MRRRRTTPTARELARQQRRAIATRFGGIHDPALRLVIAAAAVVEATMAARRRDFHREYLARLRRHPELSARQAGGHEAPGDYPPTGSFYADNPPRYVEIEGLSRRDVARAGLYMQRTRQLRADLRARPDEAPAIKRAFRKRMRQWRPIAGFRVLADPDAVLALQDQMRALDRPVRFDSGRVRPGRRRR
jgi:hypothetical protein